MSEQTWQVTDSTGAVVLLSWADLKARVNPATSMACDRARVATRVNEAGQKERRCQQCEQWLPLDAVNFPRNRGEKEGLGYVCRPCDRAYKSALDKKTRRLARLARAAGLG